MRNWRYTIGQFGTGARAGAVRTVRFLLADTAGNALIITSAALIPLLALVGGGTDMARGYMTRTSLQNACDAGVLAGRKAMSKTGAYTDVERARANKMFDFNFRPEVTGSTAVTFLTEGNDNGEVTGTATATMPTAIMKFFGEQVIDLSVECSAELQLASADVMFVLDTTGSMACNPSGGNCVSGSDSKIQGLRDAVRDFYKTVAAAVVDKDATRIRFGFVPYSQTVNLKDILVAGDMPATYFADTAEYQTRLAYFNTPVYTYVANTPTSSATTETYTSNITSSNCTKFANNTYPTSGSNPVTGGGPAPTATTSTTYSAAVWSKVSGSGGSALGTCKRTKTVTTTTYSTVTRYQFTNWRFIKSPIDVSAFKGFGAVALGTPSSAAVVPTAGYYNMRQLAALVGTSGVSGITNSNATWNGCIEERRTVQSLSMNPVPTGALDLDIDTAPTDADPDTQWKPYIANLEYTRGSNLLLLDTTSTSGTGVQSGNCPSPARLFTTVDTTNATIVPDWLDTYVNGFVARGSTYHDIGMIWGARFASETGIFADNVNADNLPSVSRHIIFMTDGVMEPNNSAYNAYGTEMYDNRIAPTGATGGATGTLANYHNARFLAVCEKAKQLGYTVWVIGFGTSITTQMKACSTAERAYYSSNTTELRNTFKYIAGEVADLRINR